MLSLGRLFFWGWLCGELAGQVKIQRMDQQIIAKVFGWGSVVHNFVKFPFMTGKSERSDIILGRQLIWCFQCQGHGVFTHLSLRASEICTAKKTKDDYMSPKRKDWKRIVRKKHMIPKLWSPNFERTCGQAAAPFITDGCAFVEPKWTRPGYPTWQSKVSKHRWLDDPMMLHIQLFLATMMGRSLQIRNAQQPNSRGLLYMVYRRIYYTYFSYTPIAIISIDKSIIHSRERFIEDV